MGRPKKRVAEKVAEQSLVKKPSDINAFLNDFNNDSEDIAEALELSRKINPTDELLVMNNTSGTLVMINKTSNRQWILDKYGKKCRMTVADILDIMGENGTIFTEGWAIVLDEDVIKYLGLTDTYEKLISPKRMEKLFDLPAKELEGILKELPITLKVDVARMAYQKIKDGHKALDSRSKVKILEKYLNLRI